MSCMPALITDTYSLPASCAHQFTPASDANSPGIYQFWNPTNVSSLPTAVSSKIDCLPPTTTALTGFWDPSPGELWCALTYGYYGGCPGGFKAMSSAVVNPKTDTQTGSQASRMYWCCPSYATTPGLWKAPPSGVQNIHGMFGKSVCYGRRADWPSSIQHSDLTWTADGVVRSTHNRGDYLTAPQLTFLDFGGGRRPAPKSTTSVLSVNETSPASKTATQDRVSSGSIRGSLTSGNGSITGNSDISRGSNGSSGLSVAAAVGTALSSVAAAIIIVVVALLFWRRARRRAGSSLPKEAGQWEKAELGSREVAWARIDPQELPNRSPVELESPRHHLEMAA